MRLPHAVRWSLLIGLSISSTTVLAASEEAEPTRGHYDAMVLRKKDFQLIDASNELEDKFRQRSLVVWDPDLQALLDHIGEKVAPPSTDPYIRYRFFILRDPSPNAFALPNGDIYIHSGMLARMQSEDELAALLAHEVNHVAGHHSVISNRKARSTAIAGAVLSGVAGDIGALISVGLAASVFAHSRQMESEADIRSIKLLTDAGYRPDALVDLLDTLRDDPDGLNPRFSSAWNTHPKLEERRNAVIQLLPAEKAPVGATTTYASRVRHLKALTVQDYLQADYPRTAIALASEMVENEPQNPTYLTLLGESWFALGARSGADASEFSRRQKVKQLRARYRRTREERQQKLLESEEGQVALRENLGHAQTAYEQALQVDVDHAPAHRGKADVWHTLGEYKQAARAYMQYLKLRPQAEDRPIIVGKLKQIKQHLIAAKESAQ